MTIRRTPATVAAGILFLAVSSPLIAQITPGTGGDPTVQARIQQFTSENPGTLVYEHGPVIGRVYGKAFGFGGSPKAVADAFVASNASLFGAEPADLAEIGNFPDGRHMQGLMYNPETGQYKFTAIHYTQMRGGIPVYGSELNLLVRNEPGFPLVLASANLRDLGDFQVRNVPAPETFSNRAQRTAERQMGQDIGVDGIEYVIWAGIDNVVEQPRLAVKFIAETGQATDPSGYAKWLYICDATTGQVIHMENQVLHVDIQGSVQGNATQNWGADACDNEAPRGLPYARVGANGNFYFADVNGNFNIPNGGATPVTVSAAVRGSYFLVNNQAPPASTLSESVTPPGPVAFLFNADNTSEFQRAEVNAYIHANVVRDYVLGYHPTYPVIANQTNFPVNVNINTTCNAFYNGSSINFYRSGGGCSNTANSTVVYHEYGHHLVASGGSGQGAYGEGMSDCIAILISDVSCLGNGFHNCGTCLRNAVNNCNHQPTGCSSCGSAAHTCGQVISGAIWGTRNALSTSNPLTYRHVISSLTINSILLHTGTSITPQITIDFLTLDDDDANIGNGTPHYTQINAGFTAKNMPAPALSLLNFQFPNGLPTQISPNGGTTTRVVVSPIAGTPQPGTGTMHLSINGGTYTQIPMTEVMPNEYDAVFPAVPCGQSVRFYFSASTTAGQNTTWPAQGAAAAFSAISAASLTVSFDDTMETNMGWTGGQPGDTATSGQWVRVDPNGTQAAPADDHTPAPGIMCWVTGQGTPGGAVGQADVDNGFTTLLSPMIDATGDGGAIISYWRWYSTAGTSGTSTDPFVISVSNNNGSTWTVVETIPGAGANGGWVYSQFNVGQFVIPTNQVRVRFVAQDINPQSIVEAGVDDFQVRKISCGGIVGDLNGDGSVGPADLGILLGSWGACPGCPADLNGDGSVGPADLGILLGNWG